MHCELVVPGLFASPAASAEARLPALELLLARGRCTAARAQRLEDWLRDAFELGNAPLAAGALSLLGAEREPGDEPWSRADPVHLQLMRDRLVLVPAAALDVKRDEAEQLVAALTRHFSFDFQVVSPTAWSARVAEELALDTPSPLELAGRDVELGRPAGPGAAAAHRILNEAQMALHDHPVNSAREARGEPALNSVWFWGFGRKPRALARRWNSVSADDPIARGLAKASGARAGALPAGVAEWLDGAPDEGRHLIVLDGLRLPLALGRESDYHEARSRLESEWFAPLLAALRAGRVGMVTVHVPDGAKYSAYETIRGDLRRFWRRPRAVERYS